MLGLLAPSTSYLCTAKDITINVTIENRGGFLGNAEVVNLLLCSVKVPESLR